MKKKNNHLWYILGGVAIVALIILIVYVNSNKTSTPACNSPYILVGNSCCLDQDYNGICDSDQPKPQVQEPIYQEFNIIVLLTHNGYSRGGLPSFADTIYSNWPLTGFIYVGGQEFYNAGIMYVYTNSQTVDQKITCYLKEYYDSKFNMQFTLELDSFKTFAWENIGYEKNTRITQARYDYECTGEKSGRKQIGSILVSPVYP
jgi:hypothetical protein